MESKGHLIISSIKSGTRIISCIYAMATGNLIVFTAGLLLAELLGIVEELVDKRE